MKLHKGEEVTCPQGHRCGFVRRDVQDADLVTAKDIAVTSMKEGGETTLRDLHDGDWIGYVCPTCEEQVARLEGENYTVHVAARGWVT